MAGASIRSCLVVIQAASLVRATRAADITPETHRATCGCKHFMLSAWVSMMQAKRAAGLLAAAQHAGAEERRPAKRQRQQGLRGYVGPPEHILLGARISVFWPDDDAFYKVCPGLAPQHWPSSWQKPYHCEQLLVAIRGAPVFGRCCLSSLLACNIMQNSGVTQSLPSC